MIENVEDLRAELQSQFLSNGELLEGSSCAGLLLKKRVAQTGPDGTPLAARISSRPTKTLLYVCLIPVPRHEFLASLLFFRALV